MTREGEGVVLAGWTLADARAQSLADADDLYVVESEADIAALVDRAASGMRVVIVAEGSGPVLELLVGELRRVGRVTIHRPGEPMTFVPDGPPSLPADSRELLTVLADGVSLGEAARQLHMSRRTADRRLADARRALNVSTTAQLIAALQRDGTPLDSGVEADPVPLVGRDEDLVLVTGHLAADRAVLIVGEGGIGKTALLRTAASLDGRPAHRVVALESLRWKEYGPLSPALGGEALTGDIEAVAAAVEAAVGPDLLVVDDLHLADPSTQAVVTALVGRVALVAAARPNPSGGADLTTQLADAGAAIITLGVLDDDAATVLARSLDPSLGVDRIADIVSGSGGLPLMVEFLSGSDPEAPVGHGLVPALDALSPEGVRLAVLLSAANRPVTVDEPIAELVSAGIATQVQGRGYRIRHALIAEEVLCSAEPSIVAAAHRRLAGDARDPALAAQHWRAAGRNDEARQAALDAVDAARSPSDRARLLVLAAECSEREDAPPRWLDAAAALSVAGLHDEALTAVDQANPQALGTEQAARASLIRCRALWHQGDAASAVASAMAGLQIAEGTGSRVEALLLVESIRCEVLSTGIIEEHDARLDRAARIIDEAEGRAAFLNVAALLPYFRHGQGLREWEAGLAAARIEGDVDTLMRCANNVIMWNESSGDQAVALEMAVAMADEAADAGLGSWELQFTTAAANLMYHQGRYDDALALLERIEASVLDVRTREQARVVHAAILIDLGLLEAAGAYVDPIPDESHRDWLHDDSRYYLNAALELASGRPREALKLATAFRREAPTDSSMWTFLLPVRAWAEHDLGLPVSPCDDVGTIPLIHGLATEAHGVACIADDPDGAVVILDEAAAIGAQWSRAQGLRAEWGAAEASRLAGAEDAVDRLLAVEAAAAELRLEPLLARVHRSLRLVGVTRAARRAADRSGLLTERERLVLDLVSDGSSYTEVARRLGVGRPTVRRLLDNGRLKLGAKSRLAAVAAGTTT